MPESGCTEAERNRLLRRIDWRFLLADPCPARVLSLSAGRLGSALHLIAPGKGENGPPYHLVAGVNPTQSALASARAALEPDGAFYGEWWWPRPWGAERLRRELERAGFVDVRLYWPVPPPARAWPAFWLPLDAPETVQAFFAGHPEARSIGRRLRLRAWELGERTGMLTPICAVARKSGASTTGTMAGVDVRALLAVDRPLDTILLTSGQRSRNKVVALVYQEGRARLALKVARTPESVPGLRREAAVLRTLDAAPRIGGIPTVAAIHDSGAWLALAETALEGYPLYHRLRPNTYHELCLLVTQWLIRLAESSRSNHPQTWWQRTAGPALAEFADAERSDVSVDLAARAADVLQGVGDLPVVCEHRDCAPWNVSIGESGAVAVVDWESAELQGTPAADLVYFLTYTAFFLDGAIGSGREVERYRALLDPTTFTGSVAHECLSLYCRATGLDPAILPAIRLWTWMTHSRSERERLLEDAGTDGRPASDCPLFVRLWREEMLRLTA